MHNGRNEFDPTAVGKGISKAIDEGESMAIGEDISTAIDEGEEPESMAIGEGKKPASMALGTQSDHRQIQTPSTPQSLDKPNPDSQSQPPLATTGKDARRRRKTARKRERGISNADKIATAADSPHGTELQRSTRRALAAHHGELYDKDGFMKHEEHKKRFCNICEDRFDEMTTRSTHCNCPAHICVSCRVEQLFAEIKKHDAVIGKCCFCLIQMAPLPPVPPTWSHRLNLTPRRDIQKWNELAMLFRAVGKPVRTVFPGENGNPEHIILSVGGDFIWEGTGTEEAAIR